MLVVTATNLPRLMGCNGSRLMTGFTPVVERDNTTRDEGDAAHWFVKEVNTGKFTAEELTDRRAENGTYITPEMVEYLSEYMQDTKDAQIEVETTFAGQGWQVSARADAVKYDPTTYTLTIPDLKYGWHIVEPEKNWTLIAHAIGWAHRYSATHRIEVVRFVIYQPRAHHPLGRVRTWEITGNDLLMLLDELTRTLSNPSDVLNTGEHCYRCPAMWSCPAFNKAKYNAIEASEKAFVDNIDNEGLSIQLDHLTRAMAVLKQSLDAFSDLAVHRVREGQVVKNYSLEKSQTNFYFPDHLTAPVLQAITGKKLVKEKLMTPAQAVEAGVPKKVVDALKTRHETGTKLVRIDAHAKATKLLNQTTKPKGN